MSSFWVPSKVAEHLTPADILCLHFYLEVFLSPHSLDSCVCVDIYLNIRFVTFSRRCSLRLIRNGVCPLLSFPVCGDRLVNIFLYIHRLLCFVSWALAPSHDYESASSPTLSPGEVSKGASCLLQTLPPPPQTHTQCPLAVRGANARPGPNTDTSQGPAEGGEPEETNRL